MMKVRKEGILGWCYLLVGAAGAILFAVSAMTLYGLLSQYAAAMYACEQLAYLKPYLPHSAPEWNCGSWAWGRVASRWEPAKQQFQVSIVLLLVAVSIWGIVSRKKSKFAPLSLALVLLLVILLYFTFRHMSLG